MALASATLARGRQSAQGQVLPMPVHAGNLRLNQPIIEWMSAKKKDRDGRPA
jgi:hypothetical protein